MPNILRNILLLILGAGFLAVVFMAGIVVFAIAVVISAAIFLYLRIKYSLKSHLSDKDRPDDDVIDVDYEIIDDKK